MSRDAAFSEILREQRRTAGYSQEELAERAGLSVGAIASLEQGLRRAPHRETVRALADALGPSASVHALLEEAAARARGRHTRGDSGIPVSLTSFIERNEVDEVEALLADHRLLTITGSGGIGKTRVATEVARRVEALYDETRFIDLLPARDGSQVTPQIAARLNVPVDGEDGLAAIIAHLRPRRALLFIDNCEHVVGDAALILEKLLRRCPNLTFLTTSREALVLSGELAYRLPSMDVKTAAALFEARAREADPKWYAGEERLALVLEICKELDGIPLAIELAASRVSTLGLEALRTRLKGGIALTGTRDLEPRHQTMAATIAWSYDMLTAVETLLFRRLSVFMGGFSLEAAEDICSGETLRADMVAEALSQLVLKSLINAEHAGTSTRYRFLEPIRAFAWERLLESGELESTMLRFLDWLNGKASILESEPPAQMLVEERIELDNVRFAVRWAVSILHDAAIVSAASVLIGFRRVWFVSGRQAEFRNLAFGLIERLKENEHRELVALLMHSLSPFLSNSELLALSERAIALLVETGHEDRAAEIHARCASFECERGNAVEAERHLVEGEALLKTSKHPRPMSSASFAAGGAYVRCLLKNYAGARALLDKVSVPHGDPYEIDISIVRAIIESREGHTEKAMEILTSAKASLERGPYAKHYTILVCGNLTGYHMDLGNTRAAEDEVRQAISATLDARNFQLTTAIADLGRYAAFFAATSGRVELAARLLGACDRHCDPASLEDDATSRELAWKTVLEQLSLERADALRRIGSTEDLYELFEEFLAQPAAADNARPSATSSPRATSVTRSSSN